MDHWQESKRHILQIDPPNLRMGQNINCNVRNPGEDLQETLTSVISVIIIQKRYLKIIIYIIYNYILYLTAVPTINITDSYIFKWDNLQNLQLPKTCLTHHVRVLYL